MRRTNSKNRASRAEAPAARGSVLFGALLLLAGAAGTAPAQSHSPLAFRDISQAAGTAMKHRSLHPDPKIAKAQTNFENVYAKGYYATIRDVCILDANGDGAPDIAMLAPDLWARLWLGDGRGTFAEIPADRLAGGMHGYRLLAFDFGGDGAQDLLMTDNIVLEYNDPWRRGRSSGTLALPTREDAAPDRFLMVRTYTWTEGVTHLLADFDNDGWVDFGCGSSWGEYGPRNDGCLRCTLTENGAIALDRTRIPLPIGMQCVAADFDGDGLTDILSRGYWKKPGLLRNKGRREFENVIEGSGLESMPVGGAVAVADFNNDGFPDIYVAGCAPGGGPDGVRLYANQGGFKFKDVTEGSGLVPKDKGLFEEKGGTATVADFDNDGLPDLFVCDGDVNRLYRNLGNFRFQEVSGAAGIPAAAQKESGNAVGDLDRDGLVDLVFITPSNGVAVLKNVTPGAGGWVQVALKGTAGNPEAGGARVTVYRPGELGRAGAILGYQENIFSTDFRIPRPLHFGLGAHRTCDVRVVFPGGRTVDRGGVGANTVLAVSLQDKGS